MIAVSAESIAAVARTCGSRALTAAPSSSDSPVHPFASPVRSSPSSARASSAPLPTTSLPVRR